MLRGATRELSRRCCLAHQLACRRSLSHGSRHRFPSSQAVAVERPAGVAAPTKENASQKIPAACQYGEDTPSGVVGEARSAAAPAEEKHDSFRTLSANRRHDEHISEGAKKKNKKAKRREDVGMSGGVRLRIRTLQQEQKKHVRERASEMRVKPATKQFSPIVMLTDVLERKGDWKLSLSRAVSARGPRICTVLLQSLLFVHPEMDTALARSLPRQGEWGRILERITSKGYSLDEINRAVYIMNASTDEERCKRFLQDDSFKPDLLLRYLIRHTATHSEVETLSGLIEYYGKWFDIRQWVDADGQPLAPESMRYRLLLEHAKPANATKTIALLAKHCLCLEPRLLVNLAKAVARCIEGHAATKTDPGKAYISQCSILNAALTSLQPLAERAPPRGSFPNAYLWEAQQILLAAASSFEKPLMVDHAGFRAIREVLAGQAKNQAEIHSARRQKDTSPPYMQPGDGLDENSAPETNWSRAVQAGMMMQEAGFAKQADDEALDILQGMAPDGTPTIQQRTMGNKKRPMSVWEASIRATRNAEEAWQVFQSPPENDMQPDLFHYAAMFEKLTRRTVSKESGTNLLPGDKALNFPVDLERNLTEFEKARRQPPSLHELYGQMVGSGILPQGPCLWILVENAESVERAHQYLLESQYPETGTCLMARNPDPELLREVPLGLFTAYLRVLSNKGKAGDFIKRAMDLIDLYLSDKTESRLIPFLWTPVVQGLSVAHRRLKMPAAKRVGLLMQAFEQVEQHGSMSLEFFLQTGNALSKMATPELTSLISDLSNASNAERNALRYLFDRKAWGEKDHPPLDQPSFMNSAQAAFLAGAGRLKQKFDDLVAQEQKTQDLLAVLELPVLDKLLARQDPVQAGFASRYMAAMVHLGEVDEMERTLQWLIREWGQPEVREAVRHLGELPRYADFSDVLCMFRLFAEPMLESHRTDALRESIAAAGLDWPWPDDEALEQYRDNLGHTGQTVLAVYQWVRYNQAKETDPRSDGET